MVMGRPRQLGGGEHDVPVQDDSFEEIHQMLANLTAVTEKQLACVLEQKVQIFPLTPRDPTSVLFKQFRQLSPPVFKGTTNPFNAEAWIKKMENIFNTVGCLGNQRMTFATFMLEGEGVNRWWDYEQRMLHEAEGKVTWEAFSKAFYERYFPDSIRDQLESKFLKLIQGSKTVTEYEMKFSELVHYAPHIAEDESNKCRRFFEGLRKDIRSQIIPSMLRDFNVLIEQAKLVETNCDHTHNKVRESKRMKFAATSQRGGQNGRQHSSDGSTEGVRDKCHFCNRSHPAHKCPLITRACFQCSQINHFSRTKASRDRPKGRRAKK